MDIDVKDSPRPTTPIPNGNLSSSSDESGSCSSSEESNFPCSVCQEVIQSLETWQEHTIQHRLFEFSSFPRKSDESVKVSPTQPVFPVAYFPCGKCRLGFTSEEGLKVHNEETHGSEETRGTEETNGTEKVRGTKEGDVNWISLKNKYPCPLEGCERSYDTEQRLSVHSRGHTDRDNFPYECRTCGSFYQTLKVLERHTKTSFFCNKDKQFKCEGCPAIFTTNWNAKQHFQAVHEKQKREFCGRCRLGVHKLKDHLKTVHSKKRSFGCSHCGLTFKTRCTLQSHFLTHGAKHREFECEVCGLTFVRKGDLKTHTKYVHSVKRRFVCSLCGSQFKRQADLNKHFHRKH